MMLPSLIYAENPQTNEVACLASLVPTFEPPAPQEAMEVLDDELPEATNLGSHGSDFHFYFLLDRSGSMREYGRMESAINALKLFIRSLPEGCHFSIISFGSRVSQINSSGATVEKNEFIAYNENTKQCVLNSIDNFTADHGGTNIRNPLKLA